MPAIESTPARSLATIWELPDDLWEEIEPILDCFYPVARTGRPRADLRRVLDGIIHRLRSGRQWNQMPERFGASSTVHGWFQRFSADGFLEELWAYLITECQALGDVWWEWQAADGVMGKSRFEGGARGPNPTDRAKMGTKKSVIVDRSSRVALLLLRCHGAHYLCTDKPCTCGGAPPASPGSSRSSVRSSSSAI